MITPQLPLPPQEMQIVMERCALGSLRHVLDRNLHLADHLQLRMARDAARGLYRCSDALSFCGIIEGHMYN